MDLIQHFDSLHAFAGFMVGVLVGLTGVGGGSLMTPILVLLFNQPAQTAVGTDLLFAAVTKMAGSAVHGWKATVDWRIMRLLATGSIPAALVTVSIIQYFGKIGKSTEHVILLVLGVMLVLTAIATLFQ